MAKSANLDPSEWVDRYGDYLFRYAMLRLRDRSGGNRLLHPIGVGTSDHPAFGRLLQWIDRG